MAQPHAQPCDAGLIAAQPCPREAGREIAPSRRRLILFACILASSMGFIDGSALNVALPALRADFGADFVSVQWVLNGYVVALAALTLIGGAMGDSYGKARMLIVGCAAFALASIACALAPSVSWLIAARIAQGAAAAIVTPVSLALIGASYPRAERNGAVGTWAAASALTTAGGPILGGWLTQTFGWQAVFWINPPIAAAAIALLFSAGRDTRRDEPAAFDWIGAALIATSLAGFAWALSGIGGAEMGAGETSLIAAAAIGFVALGGFVFWERRASAPLTPPRLFKRSFTALNVATLFIYAALSMMFFAAPFELVERRGLTATEAGLVFLPFTLAVGFLSRLFGGLADRMGARLLLIIGPIGAALAYAWMALAHDAHLWLAIIAPMTLLGLGFAALIAPLTASVLSSVEDRDQGLASGINNTAARAAQLLGVALAAGLATLSNGWFVNLASAAALSLAGALAMLAFAPTGRVETARPPGKRHSET
jgi:EmrB/QacA subfamily drug resistance transporter